MQFMESVDTELKTYGGGEKEGRNTFGVPRDSEELKTNTFATVSYNATRSALLETDKAVRFDLQVTFLPRWPAPGQMSLFPCMHTVDYEGFVSPRFRTKRDHNFTT